MSARQCDVLIIGGGLVGLATARHLQTINPRLKTVLIEKEGRLAAHQSSRNSGVIHAGIYYEPGSLKAQLCSRGHQALMRYCNENSIAHAACGKLIVATDDAEALRLDGIYERGIKNQVPGLRMLSSDSLREREPNVCGVKALLSPVSAIVDYGGVARSYAKDFEAVGGEVRPQHAYVSSQEFNGSRRIVTTSAEFDAKLVINCGGLHAEVIARDMGSDPGLRIIPFRGDFFKLRDTAANLVKTLIYPVPDPALPFLGVHLTPTVDNTVKAGPNAILATRREGYSGREFSFRDVASTLSYPGFWKFALRYVRPGCAELNRTLRKPVFARAVQKLLPAIESDDLIPAPSGVRAQAIDTHGRMVDDFRIDEGPGTIHVLNAPSPAATSSLMIGKLIADKALKRLDSG